MANTTKETTNTATKNPRLPKNITTKTSVDKKVETLEDKVGKIEKQPTITRLEDIKPNVFLTYKEYKESMKEKNATSIPVIRNFDRIMEEVLIVNRSTNNYYDGYETTSIVCERVPSNKFVTIANMVNYIQRKLDEVLWYIGLTHIDCIVLTKSGKLELYSIDSNPDTSLPPFGSKATNVNFNVIKSVPYIADEEIKCVDKHHMRMGYNLEDKKKKDAGKDLNKLFINEVNNRRNYGFDEDAAPLVYWTEGYANRLYPIDVINKVIEGKPYPLIFSSECFIER